MYLVIDLKKKQLHIAKIAHFSSLEESLEEAEFADLVDNPERYTSYKGFNYKGLNLILGKNQEKNFVVFGYFAFTGIPIFSEWSTYYQFYMKGFNQELTIIAWWKKRNEKI